MSASGMFSMEPNTGARISVVPVTLTPELLRTLEEMIKFGKGAAVKFDTKGRGGQFIVPGHGAADFSLSQAKAPLPSILKEIGQKVEVVRPETTAITVDSYRKEAVDGSEGKNLKRKYVDSKAETRTSSVSRHSVSHSFTDITIETEEKLKKLSVERTTPESGYGTDLSTRLGEFEEEEKVQDADELSEETPFKPKRRRDDLPAPLPRRKPGHRPSSKAPPPASSSKENAKMSISISRKRLMCYPNVDTSFLTKYPPLQNERDRKGYEVMYKKCYHENYIPLYNKLEQRANEWRRLDACLRDTSNDAVEIKAKMEKIARESQADKDVPYWKYLHEKLSHIKRMGAEWDSKQVLA